MISMRDGRIFSLLIVLVLSALLTAFTPGCKQSLVLNEAGDMVQVSGGTFTMGCYSLVFQCNENEVPHHKVTLSNFWLDVHEVTVAEYEDCVRAGSCSEAHIPREDASLDRIFYNWGVPDRRNHPVNGVDWHQASAYCAFKGKRLPTEAEFDYVLRGRQEGYYPWGDEWTIPERFGNYMDESGKKALYNPHDSDYIKKYNDGFVSTSPVCSFRRNAFGLCDITGNVSEWCSDWFDGRYYSTSPAVNPKGPDTGMFKLVRGGSWKDDHKRLAVSFRGFDSPDQWYYAIGFRCAKD